MAKKPSNVSNKGKSGRKMKTSIGKSVNTVYNKKRHKKNGKKNYRGQGK